MKRPLFLTVEVAPNERHYINIEDISRLVIKSSGVELFLRSGWQTVISGEQTEAVLKLITPFTKLDEDDMPDISDPWQ
ncbi:MAG TPA: hypothetical protein VGB17_11895 [Pyrinomonadaceae bacterium]|jgi:hypothetical protein